MTTITPPNWSPQLFRDLEILPYRTLQAICKGETARDTFDELGLTDTEWMSCHSDTIGCHAKMMNNIRRVTTERRRKETSAQAAKRVGSARCSQLLRELEVLSYRSLQAICNGEIATGVFDELGLNDVEWKSCHSDTIDCHAKMMNNIRTRVEERAIEWDMVDLMECIKIHQTYAKEQQGVPRSAIVSTFAPGSKMSCDAILDRAQRDWYVTETQIGDDKRNNLIALKQADIRMLVACIKEVQSMTGTKRVRRSAVGIVYARLEADTAFKAVVNRAVQGCVVTVGGDLGNAWIELCSDDNASVSRQGSTVSQESEVTTAQGTDDSIEDDMPILVACIKAVQSMTGTKRVRRSAAGIAYARLEANTAFRTVVARAKLDKVVYAGCDLGNAWIELCGDDRGVDEHTTTQTSALAAHIADLLQCIQVVQEVVGQKRVRRSAVGIQYTRLATTVPFRTAVAQAVRQNVVAVGGELGNAWIAV